LHLYINGGLMFGIKKHSKLIVVLVFVALFDLSLAAHKHNLAALEAEKNQLINEILATWKESIESNGLGHAKGDQKSMEDKLADHRKVLETHFVGHYNTRNADELIAINKRLSKKLATVKKYAMPQPVTRSSKYTKVGDSSDFWRNTEHEWSDVDDAL